MVLNVLHITAHPGGGDGKTIKSSENGNED